MASANPPYLSGYGTITKTLDRIKKASTPAKFSQDFLATKLDLKGGSPKQVIPFLKRTGFLHADGTPTELYEQFRNEGQSGAAAAQALRTGYSALYDINEYIHDAEEEEIKGIIIQATGTERDSRVAKAIFGSFKALREFASFDAEPVPAFDTEEKVLSTASSDEAAVVGELRLGYTINLHLPSTSDVAVFNAIFKSLRENLLRV